MSEEVINNQAPSAENIVLPSEEVAVVPFINDESLVDGKFKGKWNNADEMAEHIQKMESKYGDLLEANKAKDAQVNTEIDSTSKELKAKALQENTVRELAPEFIKNGMQLNDDMIVRLKETGLTETEIKLGAYELKEAQVKNANYVGGEENYNIIMDYHAENMTHEQKVAFNYSMENTNNSEALMIGLQTMYEKNIGAVKEVPTESTDRFRGEANLSSGIQPYSNRSELMKDKLYADRMGTNSGEYAKYKQRLAMTPDEIWNGR